MSQELETNWMGLYIAIQCSSTTVDTAFLLALEVYGMQAKELSRNEIKEIRRLATNGIEYEIIAKKFGISYTRIDTMMQNRTIKDGRGNYQMARKLEEAASLGRRCRAYWSTFCKGDRIVVQIETAKGFVYFRGMVTFVNESFMNVLRKNGMTSITIKDLLVKDKATKIKHATQRIRKHEGKEIAIE